VKAAPGSRFGNHGERQNLSVTISENVRAPKAKATHEVTFGGTALKKRGLMRKDI
jgi:hypothetical protein